MAFWPQTSSFSFERDIKIPSITRDRITERQQKHAVFDNKNIDEEANRRDVG